MAIDDPRKKKKKRKKKESLEHKRNRILVALGIFAVVYALNELGVLAAAFGTPGDIYASFVLFLVPFLIAGYDVLQKAFNNIRRGKAFDESFLMAVATIGAFAMGSSPIPIRTWPKAPPSCCSTRSASCSRHTPWARAASRSAP